MSTRTIFHICANGDWRLALSQSVADCIVVVNAGASIDPQTMVLQQYEQQNQRYTFPANIHINDQVIAERNAQTAALLTAAMQHHTPTNITITLVSEHSGSSYRRHVFLRTLLNNNWPLDAWRLLIQYKKCTISAAVLFGFIPPPVANEQ